MRIDDAPVNCRKLFALRLQKTPCGDVTIDYIQGTLAKPQTILAGRIVMYLYAMNSTSRDGRQDNAAERRPQHCTGNPESAAPVPQRHFFPMAVLRARYERRVRGTLLIASDDAPSLFARSG